MTEGPRKRMKVRRRGRIRAGPRPAMRNPITSASEYLSKSAVAPNMWTKTGEMRVMKAAEMNLLLIVSS